VGFSAVLFQDQFGMVTFDEGFRLRAATRPRVGRPHVLHCLDQFQQRAVDETTSPVDLTAALAGHLRKTSMVPVISDFLFADAGRVIGELSLLNGAHDVLLMMMDARFAYELPTISAGWIETRDIETGSVRTISRREFVRLTERVEEWQAEIQGLARDADLDIVRIGLDQHEMVSTLVELVAERRLRRI
jgi:hypothetical protein